MMRFIRRMAVPVAVVAGIGGTATLMSSIQQDPVSPVDAQAVAVPEVGEVEALAASFRNASRVALAGVVHVQVEAAPRQVSQRGRSPFEGTPFEGFDFFFDIPQQQPMPRSGSGSGFIISEDGYILTNNHVIENATSVTVTLTDRRTYEASVVGRDPNTDVAVLKVAANEALPVVRFGNSDDIEVGDWVLALGYPLSLGETVTAGIVSAKGKSIGIMSRNNDAVAPLEHFIQTDAAINPGNSGGPLVNLRGEAIGINTAIASPTGVYSGYGFAVPISIARRVADDLIEFGTVHRPRLAIEISNVTPVDIEALGLSGPNGALVRTVQEGPAKEAGIRAGDLIVAIDGAGIRDTGELMETIALRRPGERVRLDVVRDGRTIQVDVTLGAFETPRAPVRAESREPARDAVAQLGFAATELTPAVAREFDIQGSEEGVVIARVDRGGPAPADLVGLRIRSINGREIRNLDDLRSVARGLEAGQIVTIRGLTPAGEEKLVNYRIR